MTETRGDDLFVSDTLKDVYRIVSNAKDEHGFQYSVHWSSPIKLTTDEWEVSASSDFGFISDEVLRTLRGALADRADAILCARPVYRAYFFARCVDCSRCRPEMVLQLSARLKQNPRYVVSAASLEDKLRRLLEVHAEIRYARQDRMICKVSKDERDVFWSAASKSDVLDAYRRSRLEEIFNARVSGDVGTQIIENVHAIDVGEIYSVLDSLIHVAQFPTSYAVTANVHERWVRVEFRVMSKRSFSGDDDDELGGLDRSKRGRH